MFISSASSVLPLYFTAPISIVSIRPNKQQENEKKKKTKLRFKNHNEAFCEKRINEQADCFSFCY